MKYFIALYLIIILTISQAFAGLPPTTGSGLYDATKPTTFNFQTPYNLATTTASGTKLLESGYQNLLTNPSFEHSTADTGWTNVGGANVTFTKETTTVVDGKQSMKLVFAAASGLMWRQQVTPPIQVLGINLEKSIWANTTTAGYQVCAYAASTPTQCVSVATDGNWHKYEVDEAGPSSGNVGVGIVNNTGTAGTIYLDDAYVGKARGIGTGVPNNVFTSAVNSNGTLDNPNGSWISTCTVSGTSNYACPLNGFTNIAPKCVTTPNSGSGIGAQITALSTTSITVQTFLTSTLANTASSFNITCTRAGTDFVQPTITPNIPSAPTITKLTGGSGTYTIPVGAKYLRVRMVGGGGGGGGSGSTSGTAATSGGNTTFGTSLLVANGGSNGGGSGGLAGAGGSASLGTGPIGTAITGGIGGGSSHTLSFEASGGAGGSTPFGGAGQSQITAQGTTAAANTGSGGGGAGAAANTYAGAGGSAGGYVDAIIANSTFTALGSSVSFAVGAAGSGGGAGTSGYIGGAGAAGYIEITEYYGEYNVPLLVGSVTSNASEALRFEGANVNNTNGSVGINAFTSNWITGNSCSGSGTCTYNLVGSPFSLAPYCTCSPNGAAATSCAVYNISTSTISVATYNGATPANENNAKIICLGNR